MDSVERNLRKLPKYTLLCESNYYALDGKVIKAGNVLVGPLDPNGFTISDLELLSREGERVIIQQGKHIRISLPKESRDRVIRIIEQVGNGFTYSLIEEEWNES